jgi:hypothetical protein
MLGRYELLELLAEVELSLLLCGMGASTFSTGAVAMAILSKFSWVTAAHLDVLIDKEEEEEEDE